MNSKIKNIIIFSIIGLALVLIYIFFIKKTPEETSLLTPSTPPISSIGNSVFESDSESAKAGEGFISLLLSVKSIKLDDTIFSSLTFSSLKDSSILLVQEGNEGRPNPFAPIGYESLFFTTAPIDVIQTEDEINPT